MKKFFIFILAAFVSFGATADDTVQARVKRIWEQNAQRKALCIELMKRYDNLVATVSKIDGSHWPENFSCENLAPLFRGSKDFFGIIQPYIDGLTKRLEKYQKTEISKFSEVYQSLDNLMTNEAALELLVMMSEHSLFNSMPEFEQLLTRLENGDDCKLCLISGIEKVIFDGMEPICKKAGQVYQKGSNLAWPVPRCSPMRMEIRRLNSRYLCDVANFEEIDAHRWADFELRKMLEEIRDKGEMEKSKIGDDGNGEKYLDWYQRYGWLDRVYMDSLPDKDESIEYIIPDRVRELHARTYGPSSSDEFQIMTGCFVKMHKRYWSYNCDEIVQAIIDNAKLTQPKFDRNLFDVCLNMPLSLYLKSE